MKTTKIIILTFTLLILNSSFLIRNCMSQWVQINYGMGNQNVYSLANNGNNIFAGTASNGVFLSTNNGLSWAQTSLNNQSAFSLAVSGNNVFAGTSNPGNGIYKSSDNGTTWTQTSLNNQTVYSLALIGNNVFAGTLNNGIYLSTNNGTTWTQTSLNNLSVPSLAINGNYIFAGTYSPGNGVYISTDNGTTWTLTSLTSAVWSFGVNGNNVFAGTNPNGVLKSTDNGATWTQTTLTNVTVYSFIVNGNNVFAGTYPLGVYVSSDNGTSWVQRNEGLSGGTLVRGLCLLNNFLFAGTNTTSGSVFRRQISELTIINPISNEVPKQFSLSQNYPNPFNPSTKIKFDIPAAVTQISNLWKTRLSVYNVLGKEVATLVNENLKPGTYEVDWDAANYPSGIYYYKLSSGNFTETKKAILIK